MKLLPRKAPIMLPKRNDLQCKYWRNILLENLGPKKSCWNDSINFSTTKNNLHIRTRIWRILFRPLGTIESSKPQTGTYCFFFEGSIGLACNSAYDCANSDAYCSSNNTCVPFFNAKVGQNCTASFDCPTGVKITFDFLL